jgi:ABC-type branched-subunit amino acid transport system substrate-binding protein
VAIRGTSVRPTAVAHKIDTMGETMLGRFLLIGAVCAALTACGAPDGDGSAPGIDATHQIISIGMLNDESGPVAAIGRPWAVGKRMLADQVNAGDSDLLPDGWRVRLIERDHGYNPQRSVQLFNEIRDRVLFIGTSLGTPNTLPLRPMLQRADIVAFPVSLSSKMAEFEHTPPLGASYKAEAQRAMDFAVEAAAAADHVLAAIVYQQDDFGQDGLDGWRSAARQLGVRIVSEQTYAPGQSDFTAVVNALRRSGATHVLLTTVPSATAPLLGTALQLDYQPVWIGNSPAWLDRFFDPTVLPPAALRNFHLVTSLPYWGEDLQPFMSMFKEAYDRFGRDRAPPDLYILASYAQGLVQIEAARRMIESGELSRRGYLQALRTISDFDAHGAFPETMNLTELPYVTGTRTRIMRPDLEGRTWHLVAPFAAPSTEIR